MKYIVLLVALVSGSANCSALVRSTDDSLAYVLSTMTVLFESEEFPAVQVVTSWEENSECSGTYESCPNARLLITSSMGDLYEPPFLYELPSAKGWAFVGSSKDDHHLFIALRTTLHHANVSADSRAQWQPQEYVVKVSLANGAMELVD